MKQNQIKIIDTICKSVMSYYSISFAQLMSKAYQREISEPRHVAICLAYSFTHSNQTSVGKYFGRDHATVNYALKKVASLCNVDKDYQQGVIDIINFVNIQLGTRHNYHRVIGLKDKAVKSVPENYLMLFNTTVKEILNCKDLTEREKLTDALVSINEAIMHNEKSNQN